MSTRAYGVSVLASLVLIAASAAPAAHRLFAAAANTVARELNGQELDGRQQRMELANPAADSRGDFRGRAAGGGR